MFALIHLIPGDPVDVMLGESAHAADREALRARLPARVLDAPKRGFDTPLAAWLRGPLAQPVAEALETASRAGAGQCEAAVSHDLGLSVTARMRDIETLEYQNDRSFGITVYFDHRKGSASTSDLSDTAVAESVRKACSIASYTAEDEYAGLADAVPRAL